MLGFSLAKYYKKNLESLLAVLKSKLDSWLTTVDSWWEKKQVSADAKKNNSYSWKFARCLRMTYLSNFNFNGQG